MMQSKLPITLRVASGKSDGITIHVKRGTRDEQSVLITRELLLSFGGEGHTADAFDLVTAVVGEINRALGRIQVVGLPRGRKGGRPPSVTKRVEHFATTETTP